MKSLKNMPKEHSLAADQAKGTFGVPRIVIYGASGNSLAIAQNAVHRLRPGPLAEVVAHIDDFRGGDGLSLGGAPIIFFDDWRDKFADVACFIAVGDPQSRRRLAEKVIMAGGRFPRLHDRPGFLFPDVSIGADTAVSAQSDVGPKTTIGDHVIIMPMVWVAHDVEIADYVTLGASCSISGHVIIEEGAYLGAGVTVVDGSPERPLVIGAGAKVWAGAVVTKSIPAKTTVAGNPARPLRDLVRARKAGG
jgi:sugar O-acyltransferase (sialic acid O-acetyltransferase NeuD family)